MNDTIENIAPDNTTMLNPCKNKCTGVDSLAFGSSRAIFKNLAGVVRDNEELELDYMHRS